MQKRKENKFEFARLKGTYSNNNFKKGFYFHLRLSVNQQKNKLSSSSNEGIDHKSSFTENQSPSRLFRTSPSTSRRAFFFFGGGA